jgi:hypothetical protein
MGLPARSATPVQPPGRPIEDAYVESFDGKLRDESLNIEVLYDLAEAEAIVETGRQSYNREWPHRSLAYQTPAWFAAKWSLMTAKTGQSLQHEDSTTRWALITTFFGATRLLRLPRSRWVTYNRSGKPFRGRVRGFDGQRTTRYVVVG